MVPHIAGSVQRRPVNLKSLKNWDCLWGEFPLADDLPKETETSSVELLIGNAYYLDIILPQKIEVQKGLYMLGSKLGWILSGRTSEITYDTTETNMLIMTYGTEVRRETSMLTTVDESLPLKPNLKDFWRLESIGIKDSITKTRETWPVWNCQVVSDQSDEVKAQTESEYRKVKVMFEAKLMAGEDHSENMTVQSLNAPFNLNLEKFSSVTRLWRVTALALRFVNKLRKKTNQNGPLDATEITNAETLWTKFVQRQQYGEVVDSINKSKRNNLQYQLGIYVDQHGLLRCGGRLDNAELCESAKHPILLPKGHTYTDLIVERYHKSSMHTGVSQTLI